MRAVFYFHKNHYRKEFNNMSEARKIKVVLLEPCKTARITEIDASLEGMQKVVEGYIESFSPFEEQVCIVCNEEGKINGMRPNRSVCGKDGKMIDIIFGTAFICNCNGENFGSLSDEQANRYRKQFQYPEMFLRDGSGIKAVKFNADRDVR